MDERESGENMEREGGTGQSVDKRGQFDHRPDASFVQQISVRVALTDKGSYVRLQLAEMHGDVVPPIANVREPGWLQPLSR